MHAQYAACLLIVTHRVNVRSPAVWFCFPLMAIQFIKQIVIDYRILMIAHGVLSA